MHSARPYTKREKLLRFSRFFAEKFFYEKAGKKPWNLLPFKKKYDIINRVFFSCEKPFDLERFIFCFKFSAPEFRAVSGCHALNICLQ